MRAVIALADGPEAEEMVAAVASDLRRQGAEVHLLTVVNPDKVRATFLPPQSAHGRQWPSAWQTAGKVVPPGPRPRLVEGLPEARARRKAERREALRELAERHLPGVQHLEHVEWSRRVGDAIVALADEIGAATIVVGTRAHRGLRRALFGSVADYVIRKSTVPVVVVRHGAADRARSASPPVGAPSSPV